MKRTNTISKKTKNRYFINFIMFFLFLAVTASSLYFLYVPGGYQGGRNPRFNMQIIFERETWDDIHIWSSFIISAVILLHIVLHLNWIKNVFLKYVQIWKKSVRTRNKMALLNVFDDAVAALSFLLCLISGVVLFIVPGGRGTAYTLILGIMRDTWKDIHTWTGVVMLLSVVLHLIIHFGWIKKVSIKVFQKQTAGTALKTAVSSQEVG